MTERFLPRRRLLRSSLALAGLATAGTLGRAWAQSALRVTPEQTAGPFYPQTKPLDQDADLTQIAGRSGKAAGQIVHLMGRVLDTGGEPIGGAKVEIWQANARGRYNHPRDGSPNPLDPHFEGYGSQITDDAGRYRFKTVKPGAYGVADDWTRPPHIHFAVEGRGGRLITQMYFDGEALNDLDRLLQGTARPEALIARYQPPDADMEADALAALWDVVLPQG